MTSGDRKRDWKREAEERRQAEMDRGQQVVANIFIREHFDPDFTPEPPGISPEERRRRDEYRNRLSKTNGGQNK